MGELFNGLFTDRNPLSHATVIKIVQHFEATGSIRNRSKSGRLKSVTEDKQSLDALQSLVENPHTSLRKVTQEQEFQGEWYEVERSFYLLELVTGCTTLNFTARPDNIFKVAIKTANRWNGNIMIGLLGTATPQRWNKAELVFKIDSNLHPMLVRAMPGVGNYKVLGTDYDTFALLYSCSDMGILHADLLWVLSRKKELPVTSRVLVYDILSTLNMDPSRLTLTKHNKCPKF